MMSIVDSIKGFFSKKKDDDMSDKMPTTETMPATMETSTK